MAQQSPISTSFSFSPARLRRLRESNVPIVVHVQELDETMPAAKQFDLARNLGLEPTVFLGGHMEAAEVKLVLALCFRLF